MHDVALLHHGRPHCRLRSRQAGLGRKPHPHRELGTLWQVVAVTRQEYGQPADNPDPRERRRHTGRPAARPRRFRPSQGQDSRTTVSGSSRRLKRQATDCSQAPSDPSVSASSPDRPSMKPPLPSEASIIALGSIITREGRHERRQWCHMGPQMHHFPACISDQ